MKQPEDSGNPAPRKEPDTFKQHYAGTNIAKRQVEQRDSVNAQNKAHDANKEPDPVEAIMSWWEFIREPKNANAIMAVCTLLIFITGAFYTVFAGLQWCANKQAADAATNAASTAKEALVSVQRAYVNFSTAIEPRGFIVNGKVTSWEFTVPFENSGDTPTKGMTMRIHLHLSKDKIPEDFTYPTAEGRDPLIALGPKGKTGTGPVGGVTSEALKNVQAGKEHLYIYGWSKYMDVFDSTPEHITKFCYELTEWGGSPFSTQNHPTFWSMCPHHNCTDEDCKIDA
jgi:hypothetical protein